MSQYGKVKESLELAREIKLIGDPIISISETGIGQAIKSFYGDLGMSASLLGFKNVRNGVSWIELIVRTWGFTPEEIANLDRV